MGRVGALNSTPVLFAVISAIALVAGTQLSVARNIVKRTKKGKVIGMSFAHRFSGRSAAFAVLGTISALIGSGFAAMG
jgi:hypothetical protein